MEDMVSVCVCEKCHRPAWLMLAGGEGGAEEYFHLDDKTPVLGCQREPLKPKN